MKEYIIEAWKLKPYEMDSILDSDDYDKVFDSKEEMLKYANEYGTAYEVANFCEANNNGHISSGCRLISVKVKE